MKIEKISKNYINLLEELGYKSKNVPDGSTDISHLLWMLYELNINFEMSLTKKHRWLGFIQGCLIKDEIINLKKERKRTRSILKGD
jgi:hypothetical protein